MSYWRMNMRPIKSALLTLLGVAAMQASVAHAVDIKIATLVPNQSQWMQDMRAAGKVIEERTEGHVCIPISYSHPGDAYLFVSIRLKSGAKLRECVICDFAGW